jgi:hypothetical protein
MMLQVLWVLAVECQLAAAAQPGLAAHFFLDEAPWRGPGGERR